jgi:hypothetical protein
VAVDALVDPKETVLVNSDVAEQILREVPEEVRDEVEMALGQKVVDPIQ